MLAAPNAPAAPNAGALAAGAPNAGVDAGVAPKPPNAGVEDGDAPKPGVAGVEKMELVPPKGEAAARVSQVACRGLSQVPQAAVAEAGARLQAPNPNPQRRSPTPQAQILGERGAVAGSNAPSMADPPAGPCPKQALIQSKLLPNLLADP